MPVLQSGRAATLTALALITSTALGHAQIHVDITATGSNDGSSWQAAFVDLQLALGIAVSGDQVWVAQGTYLPAHTGAIGAASA